MVLFSNSSTFSDLVRPPNEQESQPQVLEKPSGQFVLHVLLTWRIARHEFRYLFPDLCESLEVREFRDCILLAIPAQVDQVDTDSSMKRIVLGRVVKQLSPVLAQWFGRDAGAHSLMHRLLQQLTTPAASDSKN